MGLFVNLTKILTFFSLPALRPRPGSAGLAATWQRIPVASRQKTAIMQSTHGIWAKLVRLPVLCPDGSLVMTQGKN